MPLQFKNIAVGNLQDDVSGNNYAANKAVYILNLNNTLAQIFSDEAGAIAIVQDGVNNVTNSKGVFGFWVEAGDYFVQVGANKYRVSITGADYFNNRIDETIDIIVDSVAGRGAYYVAGSFEVGFTYTDINQVGTFGGADYYVYTGGLTNLPHNVTAGTDPTLSSDYAQVFYGEIDNVQGLREELNDRALYLTLSEAQSRTDLSVGQRVIIIDRDKAPMLVQPVGLTVDGWRVVGLPDGKSLEVEITNNTARVTWYGASSSISNNTPIFHAARDQLEEGGLLEIPSDTYPITEKIVINKRVNLEGKNYRGSIIRNDNTAGEDAIEFNTTWYQGCNNLTIQGNALSGYGININSSNFVANRVECRENGKSGWYVTPENWTITLNECLGRANEEDGLYAVATGPSGQVNSLYLNGGSFTLNKRHGAQVCGTVVNFKGCNLEGNEKRGLVVTTEFYSCYTLNVDDCYIESNKEGQILFDLYPSKGFELFNANIDGNYMYMLSAQAVGAAPSIQAITDTPLKGIVGINIGYGNMYLTDSLAHVDLGDAVQEQGQSKIFTRMIGNTANPDLFYKNLGNASIETYQTTYILSGYFHGKGALTYASLERSANVYSGASSGVLSVQLPVNLPSGTLLKDLELQVASDATNYDITFTVYKRDTSSIAGYSAATTKAVIGNSGNSLVKSGEFRLLTNPSNLRIKEDEEYYVEVTVQNASGGTYLYLYNPILGVY